MLIEKQTCSLRDSCVFCSCLLACSTSVTPLLAWFWRERHAPRLSQTVGTSEVEARKFRLFPIFFFKTLSVLQVRESINAQIYLFRQTNCGATFAIFQVPLLSCLTRQPSTILQREKRVEYILICSTALPFCFSLFSYFFPANYYTVFILCHVSCSKNSKLKKRNSQLILIQLGNFLTEFTNFRQRNPCWFRSSLNRPNLPTC